ncbi:MAG: aminopeptidase P family protein [Ruminococcus sp.]|nr:aminopeptidase P family protein [Ruminococcus sp.]
MTHIESLQQLMQENTCAIIDSEVNRRYFTGMKSSAGTLLVFKDAAYFIIDFRYIEKARKTVKTCEVILQGRLYAQISELIKRHGSPTLMIDSSVCTVEQLAVLSKRLDTQIASDDTLSRLISSLRIVKSHEELDKMIEAQRIAEAGLSHMFDFVEAGRTEKEIQLELDYYMLSHGAEALSFDTIALSGANTSLPHGVPSDKKVEKGDLVLLDFGAVVDGWHSDMTRTFCVGEPTDEMRKVYDIVLKAQLAGIDAVKAGISGKELDAVSRKIIADNGYGGYFGHSLGHGVGMEIHESPYASPSVADIINEGAVVTVEPGIYLEGKFGVRIEDFVIVTSDGCINMTEAPKELICL